MSNAFVLEKALGAVLSHAVSHHERLPELPVAATSGVAELRMRLDRTLQHAGVAADKVIEDLISDVQGGLHASAGGRFFGWVIGGSLPSALAADWLTSTWDQNAHNYATAPAAAVAEELAGTWLKDLFGLPAKASFALVTGCQMAHLTCLAAARHALLMRRGWDVEKDGLFGAPPIRVLSSEQAHGSISRALRMLGIGTAQLLTIVADPPGQLSAAALEAALGQDSSSATIVVLQAGDINTGAFDNFETLIPLAKRYGAWVHVDGAFGLWTAASPRLRHLMNGAAEADSWATDGHKWLNVPYDSGYAFIADSTAHLNAMAHRAAYISYSDDVRDQSDYNPEWSRRARGFSTYAAIRELGRDGIANQVERCCRHARTLTLGIAQIPGAQLLFESPINQGLVRFLDTRPNATDSDHDLHTDTVIAEIRASGEALFSGTLWRGRRAMRISVCSWRTNDADIERTLGCIARILRRHATRDRSQSSDATI
jgi:glutamate/tyrosine decarboxylase-like PLP-dependent enzyme